VTTETPLDLYELQMIAYVCHHDKDKHKKLFSFNGLDAYRLDFDTLAPGKRINKKVWFLYFYNSEILLTFYKKNKVHVFI